MEHRKPFLETVNFARRIRHLNLAISPRRELCLGAVEIREVSGSGIVMELKLTNRSTERVLVLTDKTW